MKATSFLVAIALLGCVACGGGDDKEKILRIGDEAAFDTGYTATVTGLESIPPSSDFPDLKTNYKIGLRICADDPSGKAPTGLSVRDSVGKSTWAELGPSKFIDDELVLTPNESVILEPGVCQEYKFVWAVEYEAEPVTVKLTDEGVFGETKAEWTVQ